MAMCLSRCQRILEGCKVLLHRERERERERERDTFSGPPRHLTPKLLSGIQRNRSDYFWPRRHDLRACDTAWLVLSVNRSFSLSGASLLAWPNSAVCQNEPPPPTRRRGHFRGAQSARPEIHWKTHARRRRSFEGAGAGASGEPGGLSRGC